MLPQASYVSERLGANMRKIVGIAALACAVVMSSPQSGNALDCPPFCPTVIKSPPAAPVGAGPWIVGGVGLSALSVIVRAIVVGNRQHRELTWEEASGAILVPFAWVFFSGVYQGEASSEYFLGSASKLNSSDYQQQLKANQDELEQYKMEKAIQKADQQRKSGNDPSKAAKDSIRKTLDQIDELNRAVRCLDGSC